MTHFSNGHTTEPAAVIMNEAGEYIEVYPGSYGVIFSITCK